MTVNGGSVKTLEEGEDLGVGRRRLAERSELLDDDVRVADDLALGVELLGRGEVVLVRIHEVTSLHVGDGHGNCERSVRGDGVTVCGNDEFCGGHVAHGRDGAHWRRVARASRDLLAVRDGLVGHGKAEVDEVVRRGQ